MPVLRQDVNTGSGALQIGDTNYMVGAAAPQMKQVQPAVDNRGMAIQGFLSSFMDTFTPGIQEGQKRAAAQGQIDATQDPDALKNSDAAADKQNFLMRDAYQQGYLGAAVQQSVTDFQAGITQRAQQAGLQGVSDSEFMQSERQRNAKLMQSLGQYLPHMAPDTVSAVAGALDNTRQSALTLLQKTRLGQSKINNTRTVEQGGFQAQQGFLTSLSSGATFDQSWHYLEDQANLIGSNPMMDQKDKQQQLHNLFLTTAQNLTDPDVINQLAGKAAGILGVTDPSLTSALHGEWNRAGQQVAGASLMNLQNQYDSIGKLPAYQQAQAKQNFEQQLIADQTSGRISTGQMMEFYNKVHKEQTPKLQMQGMVSAVAGSGGGLSVEALHAAAPGVSRGETQNAILEAFPNTVEGNVKLLAAGTQGNDPWIIKQALSRVGTQMSDQLDTLSTLMKPKQDDNGNIVYQIPDSVQQNVVGFMGMYQNADAITQQTLMNTLPTDWQGVVKSAIEQDPTNVNNNVLDTIKRVAIEKSSGMYKDVQSTPSAAMLNTDGALRWYQRINPVTTDSEDQQRASMNQQLQAEYNRIYSADKGLLSGKSPETINKMLVGNIQARTVSVNVGRFASNVTLPAGTTMDSYAAAAGVDAKTYQNAFQSVADNVFRAQGLNVDNMDSVRIEPNSGGALSKDFTMTVVSKSQSGIYTSQRIAMPANSINRVAQSSYAALIDQQRADGSAKAGTNIATFYDSSRGGYQTLEVSGTNSAGLRPDVFNGIMANTMRYEGFKGTKSNGSVGYGWHEKSGDSVPDNLNPVQAQQHLKRLYEERYLPMTQDYMKQNNLSGDAATSILADLTYQRPADAKALAEQMGKFQRGEISPKELYSVLRSLPTWTDAGGDATSTRNTEREAALYRWSNFEGNPRRTAGY